MGAVAARNEIEGIGPGRIERSLDRCFAGHRNRRWRQTTSCVGIVWRVLAQIADAEVIIHNAAFDLEFLDAEFARIGRPPFAQHCLKVTDSLQLAREQHPGKRNSLDALCERYQVSNAHRTLHGALLDAGLLAEVYLALTRGQDSLTIDVLADEGLLASYGPVDPRELLVLPATAEEVAAHETVLAGIEKESKAAPVWRNAPAATPA